MTSEQEFAELLARGHELHGVEFKGSMARSNKLSFTKVVRGMLGMATRRDGGLVILGIEEVNGTLHPKGLTPEQVQTWRYDDVAAGLAEYADPSVNFELEVATFQGKQFVFLHVQEFDELPVLCKKTFQTRPRRSRLY